MTDPPSKLARPASVDDLKLLLRALAEHRVEYLLIGGYALYALGYQRGTVDIDILLPATLYPVPRPSLRRCSRLCPRFSSPRGADFCSCGACFDAGKAGVVSRATGIAAGGRGSIRGGAGGGAGCTTRGGSTRRTS